MSFRNTFGVALLTAAAAASWLLVESSEQDASAPASSSDTDPGYYLSEATIFGTDEEGRTFYELRAARIRHVPDNDSIELERLHLDYDVASEAPWRLDAQRGVIPSGGASIMLAGQVRLVNTPLNGAQPTVIRTESLNVGFVEHLASTVDPVQIDRGGYVITATGLRADLKEQRLRLQSEVRGQFTRGNR